MSKPSSKFASEFLGATAAWSRVRTRRYSHVDDDELSDVEIVDQNEYLVRDKPLQDRDAAVAANGREELKFPEDRGIAHVDKFLDSRTGKYRLWPRPKTVYASKETTESDLNSVIVVSRVIGKDGEWTGYCDVNIRGKLLCEILTEVCNKICNDVDHIKIDTKNALDDDILRLIFFARSRLDEWVVDAEEKLKSLKESSSEEELKLLEQKIFEAKVGQEFIEGYYSTTLASLKDIPEGSISFNLLWTIFAPGVRIMKRNDLNDLCVLRIQNCGPYLNPNNLETEAYTIIADFICFTGKTYAFNRPLRFSIPPFEGTKKIFELSMYPFEYHPSQDIKAVLLERGDKIMRLNKRQLQEYSGDAIYDTNKIFICNQRVMVDPVSSIDIYWTQNAKPKEPREVSEITDDYKLLLNPLIAGFAMGSTKLWGSFSVDLLQDVQWDEHAMEKLQIPQERKDFLQNMIRVHGSSNVFNDIMPSKGKGLVGLLSGPSGVGKTLTVEALAEVTKRPIYVLSHVELGEDGMTMQQNFIRCLELKAAWNAIMLIDEAEVFFGKRDERSRFTSEMTSVLLRHIEQHKTIILLTTNRLESLDPAFKDRMHFHLKFENPDQDARAKIWEMFLGSVKKLSISEDEKVELAVRDLNGRQIRNAVNVAQALAWEKDDEVTIRTIETALSYSQWD